MASLRTTSALQAAQCRCPSVHPRLVRRPVIASAENKEGPSSSSSQQPQQPAGAPSGVREYKAYGMKVLESNDNFPDPEAEKDFWEGEQFANLGEILEKYFLPGLVVLGLVCGGIAARTYNEGAEVFIQPATGPDAPPILIPADKVLEAPSTR